MKFLVLFALLAAAFCTRLQDPYQTGFLEFMQKYGKSYSTDEFQFRFQTFKSNKIYIDEFNAQGNGMTLAINKYADLTHKEFQKLYLMKPITVEVPAVSTPAANPQTILKAFPLSWDWNAKGAVTPIKNQEQCGSCWSFSTTGSVEGCHQQTTGTLVGLSEQNLMDCSTAYGNMGCEGGLMTEAMEYIIQNPGIDTEASYPYTAEDGTCQFSKANIGAYLQGMRNVSTGNETDLQVKVNVGPTSVAIDASQNSFQFYSSGVYYEPACSSTVLDHGVLAVGWGVDSGTEYWIVKNSWGTDWGMNGWIWMSRNRDNNCGIATMATLPVCPAAKA